MTWVLRHYRAVLVVALLLSVVAVMLASRLRIESDLRQLLPSDHRVVVSLEELESTFGSTGSVNIVIRGPRTERRAFANALAKRLAGEAGVQEVDYRLASEFFTEKALYYLTTAEMEDLDQRVQAWTHYEYCTEAPDVCTLDPDPKAPEKLRTFVDAKRSESLKRTGFEDYYEREGIEALVMLVRPVRPSSDVEFAVDITRRVRMLASEVFAADARLSAKQVTYNLVGPYVVKADENETIRRDMLRSGIAATLGVFVILYVLFRSLRAVVILLVPLLCGVAWSLGVTQLVLAHLNTMTSLISTVVMGVGIDAGIHFLGRIRRFAQDHDDERAIVLAFHGLILPLFVASSTTFGAFAIMAVSSFPAFREFGIIAAMGVAICLLAMITVLPALCRAVGVKRVTQRIDGHPLSWLARGVLARPGLLFAGLVALTLVSFQGVRHVEFEYNGRTLQSDRARAATEADTHLISQVFGRDIHAGVLVVPTLDDAREVLSAARQRHDARRRTGDTVVAELFAAPDLLPPPDVDQAARQEQIQALAEDVPESAWERMEKRDPAQAGDDNALTREDADLLRRMLAAKPFTVDELPPSVLAKVRGVDGHYGVFAYPNFDAADIRGGIRFMQETSNYTGNSGGTYVGETTVYAAMYEMLRTEAPVVLGMAAVLIVALVFWQLRSVTRTLMTIVPLALAVWWMLAAMGAFGLKFSLFNLPILPAILGIGVDNGVYLGDRILRAGNTSEALRETLTETGGAILAATATTVVGFAAFLVANSGGLRSIGELAVLGISVSAVAAILVLPTLSVLGQRSREQMQDRRKRRRSARARKPPRES